jgi:nicotinamidase-related amidase
VSGQEVRLSSDVSDIRGPAPGGAALLLIDVINPMDFAGAEPLSRRALDASRVILRLRNEADALGVPVVYVNDNYGHWGSEKAKLVEICATASDAGRVLASRLGPRPQDFFIIKPQFSGFYATNLPVLLPRLGVSRIVLTGIAGDICVLFTAADAHMRDYDLWVPADAIACEQDERAAWALEIMRKSMDAETEATDRQTLASWVEKARHR